MQRGQIFRTGGSWYLRFYQDELRDGRPVRRRICKRLAYYSDAFRSRKDVLHLADQILAPVNEGHAQPEGSLTLAEFFEQRFLPNRTKKLRPSTVYGYRHTFRAYLKPRVGNIRLRDFRTKDGQHLFERITEDNPNLSHTTLTHAKALLSGIFNFARQEDALRGANPMQGVKAEGRRYRPSRHAYALNDILAMLPKLQEPTRTIIMTAAFSGLRASEIRGLRWEDYNGAELRVSRAVWRTHVGSTKTEESGENPVPVISVLRRALDEHRMRYNADGYIFAGERGRKPLNLANLARRVLAPTLGKTWKGWHAFRRGLGTNLYSLGVPPKVIQEVLRHADVTTTQTHYIVVDRAETAKAMQKLGRAVGKEWAKTQKPASS